MYLIFCISSSVEGHLGSFQLLAIINNCLLSRRRIRIDPFLSLCTKLKSKWIKELHIQPETLRLIEEKVGENLEDKGIGGKFLNRTAMSCAVRSRIYKWDLIKLQSFCISLSELLMPFLKSSTSILRYDFKSESCFSGVLYSLWWECWVLMMLSALGFC
jgi:hypothetical protein